MSVTVTTPADGSEIGRVDFDCPKQPGHRCYVPVRLGVHKGKTWNWDGNLARPTLTPSLDCTLCGWHGFITNGETI